MPIKEWRARIGSFFQRRRTKIWLERQGKIFEQSFDLVEKLFGLQKLQRNYDEYCQRNERVSTERAKRSTNSEGMSKNGKPYSQNDLNENASRPYAGSLNTASKDEGSNDSCAKDGSVQGNANQDLTEEGAPQSYSSVETTDSGCASGADGTQLSLTTEGVQSSNNKSSSTNPRTQASYDACESTSKPCTKSDILVEGTLYEHLLRKVNGSGPGFDLNKTTSVTVEIPQSSLEHPPNAASPAKCTIKQCRDHTSNVDNDIACIGELLLLQAGDVETNPGPNEKSQNLKSLEVCKLAELMDPQDYRKVGLALGITEDALRRYEHDKQSIEWATYHMLNDWLKTVKEEEARTILVDKLRSIPLENLADRLAAGLDTTAFSSLSDEDVQRCSEDLKHYYATRFCQIQADPLNFDKLLQFDDIFTNLELLEEEKSTKCKVPLDYDKLLETKVNGAYPKRLLVEGEGGAGKTTLCARLAWDWLKGRRFQQFKLILIVLLRNANDQTVGKVIKTYLPDSNPVEAWQIDKYILTNHTDVFLVCDGLDEYGGDFKSSQDIPEIMHNHAYKSTTVLVTSRPWRADEIRGRKELRQAYAFIAVQGFTPENLASYITKFFVKDPVSGSDLNQFMQDNDVIAENMSPYPIYTAMLCIMWKEYDQERRQAMHRLQTFSQLFREIVYFLIDHYISKITCQSYEDASDVPRRRDIALGILKKIGKMALNGLFKKRLDLSESDFKSCPEAMEAGCRIGVLSRERCFAQRKDTYNTSSPVMCTFHFPHKLFQENLAAMHLAALYRTDRSRYDQLMSQTVIPQCREFRYLVYFTSAQEKDVGVDIISRLPTKDVSDYPLQERQSDTHFLVDVAFECHSHVAAVAVQHVLRTAALTIDNEMTPHTVAGYLYVMERLHLETLRIAMICGRTVSRDAAEFISTSSSLRSLELIRAEMHDEFYKVLADHAEQAGSSQDHFVQIESLDLSSMDLQEYASASRDLGLFVCGVPSLTKVGLRECSFHDGFFSALASKASDTQIESLGLIGMRLQKNASRDLGLFVCGAPSLTKVRLYWCRFHDGFFSALASKASGTQIESLDLSSMDLQEYASASRGLGLFVCGAPSLTKVHLHECSFHDGFFSALASKASGTQIESLDLSSMYLEMNASASSRDLVLFVCRAPSLTKVRLYYCSFHDGFFSALASKASDTQIESLDLSSMDLEMNASASRDLGLFVCGVPSLTKVRLDWCSFHDGFFSALASKASDTQIERLDLFSMDLEVNASASRDLGLFVCGVPSLTEVSLDQCSFHDGFFSALASKASGTQIESLDLSLMLLQMNASRDLGLFVCGVPSLTKVRLYRCSFHDGFFSPLASKASGTQIESLDLSGMDLLMNASRELGLFVCGVPSLTKIERLDLISMDLPMNASASRDFGLFVCGVPSLTEVSLNQCSFHDDFFSALALKASGTQAAGGDSTPPCPLTRLTVDDWTLSGWTYGDMSAVFPSLKRVTLVVHSEKSYGIDLPAQLQLPGVTVLNVIPEQGSADITRRASAHLKQLPTVFPHLLKLTVTDCTWSSDDARSLLRSLSSHPHLRVLRIMRCGPDALLDSVAEEVNRAGRIRVTVDHSAPEEVDCYDREDEESDDEDISHYDHTAGVPGSPHVSQDDPTAGVPGSTHVSQDDPTAGVPGSTPASQDDHTAGLSRRIRHRRRKCDII